MRLLLDTNVVSELRKPEGSAAVKETISSFSQDSQYLSVVTIGELAKGICLMPPGRRRVAYEAWLLGLEDHFTSRILEIDLDTARIWGDMVGRAQQIGYNLQVSDSLIAATALRHGMHVVTRNVKDFEPTGVPLINPWES